MIRSPDQSCNNAAPCPPGVELGFPDHTEAVQALGLLNGFLNDQSYNVLTFCTNELIEQQVPSFVAIMYRTVLSYDVQER